jgi:uncharacterized protein (DUF1330 family)
MAVYYMLSYDIDNMQEFAKYPPLAGQLIVKYGGEVLVMDTAATVIEGTGKMMNVLVKFPTLEQALTCYNDEEYQEVKKIRINSTSNVSMVLVEEFVPPR